MTVQPRGVILKQLVLALLVGSAIASLPWLASLAENDSLNAAASLLLLPGMIVGIVAGGGRVHNTNWTVTLWATYMFWTASVYFFMRWRGA